MLAKADTRLKSGGVRGHLSELAADAAPQPWRDVPHSLSRLSPELVGELRGAKIAAPRTRALLKLGPGCSAGFEYPLEGCKLL